MTKKYYYERADYVLNHEMNKTFAEILWMSQEEFVEWLREMRKVIVYAWDELGVPPRVGWNRNDIIDQFNKMSEYPVHEFLREDVNGDKKIIRNTSVIGNACNQFFPTMMKTRINYSKNDDGRSIYDHFVEESLFDKVCKYAHRHFKRDSFYEYSRTVPVFSGKMRSEKHDKQFLISAQNGVEWIQRFEKEIRHKNEHDYWIAPFCEDTEYSGHNQSSEENETVFGETNKTESLADTKWCTLTKNDIKELNIPEKCLTNANIEKNDLFRIRVFDLNTKIFPVGFKAFRISWCQYAVNFPPLTAKLLYEKYTEHIKDQDIINIFDPSSGWGGRILGAMSVKPDRNIHYIGTDPNTDHWIGEIGVTKYEYLADFFNKNTTRSVGTLYPHTNTYEVYQLGSEVIQHSDKFKRYKGKLDLVFTSPPYFAKEAYSEDEEQSYKQFPKYDAWVEGFLRPTLTTAVEYLKSDRYLLWNIADAKFGPDMLPLEQDSRKILEELGMQYIETMKMTLAWMPGGNRIDSEGRPSYKNAVYVDGKWFKYEPIFVYYKP
jgi:hypothetical protein